MAGSTIGNAPSGENTSPDGTEKIPLSGSKFIQIANLIARKLRETAGPTTLSMGAVSDGQFLKRSSTNVVGSGVTSADVSGTTTNDSAATGYIGEYVEGVVAEASKISLTTNTVANLTSISLTAGDWDVTALSEFQTGTGTNITILLGDLSTSTGSPPTLDTTAGRLSTLTFGSSGLVMTNGLDISVVNPVYRFSLSSTTTIYLHVRGNFTVSTLKAWGILRARRVR